MNVVSPHDLRVDGRLEPLGLGSTRPRFSWKLLGTDTAGLTDSVAIQVGTTETLDQILWETTVPAAGLPEVSYQGPVLNSGQRYWWRLRCSGDNQEPWSAVSWFEMGILDDRLWRAHWVTDSAPNSSRDYRALHLRGEAELDRPVAKARAYVSALGWYRFMINGSDLTGSALVPRWTPYDDYVEYQTYDVTTVLQQGNNILAMAIGDGRFRGRIGVFSEQAVFGDRLAGWMQLEVQFADGSHATWVTDRSWITGPGPILSADPMHGERVDFNLRDSHWYTRMPAPAGYRPVELLTSPRHLIAEEVPPVREVDRIPAQRVIRTPSGKQIADFGQNFAGVVRMRLRGVRGTRVVLSHSEVLTPDGELDLDYVLELPGAPPMNQRDEVTLHGDDGWWQPWFTIHGFRYVEIDGLDHEIDPADVEGVVMSTDVPITGTFECSDSRLNQLHRNVLWSMRSNFVDTPTDCPTRERSGWTADIAVFAAAATTFADVRYFLRRYLRNLANDQLPDGKVPVVIPDEYKSGWRSRLGKMLSASVGWGDTAVSLPWTLYQYYGDTDILERQYSSMTAWVDQLARRARDRTSLRRKLLRTRHSRREQYICDTGFMFGEWLRPNDAYGLFRDLWQRGTIATAYLEHSARTVAEAAKLLGKRTDAERYRELADEARKAWRAVYLHDDGRVGNDRQDDYVRAIAFDLLDETEKPSAITRLIELIGKAGGHLGTGFLSTPMLLPVLRAGGRSDVAYELLTQTTLPSWLHQIERGATTVWETWEGYDKQGRASNSHNHYAFGAVASYLTEHLAGITPAEPGYRVIDIHPSIIGDLRFAGARIDTPFGTAASAWEIEGDNVHLTVTIPPGSSGHIRTGSGSYRVGAGTFTYSWPKSDSQY